MSNEKDVHEFFERSMKHFGKEKCIAMLEKDNSPVEFKMLIQKEIDQTWGKIEDVCNYEA